jgi:hypothetical protein
VNHNQVIVNRYHVKSIVCGRKDSYGNQTIKIIAKTLNGTKEHELNMVLNPTEIANFKNTLNAAEQTKDMVQIAKDELDAARVKLEEEWTDKIQSVLKQTGLKWADIRDYPILISPNLSAIHACLNQLPQELPQEV